jgi:hypothetical protein
MIWIAHHCRRFVYELLSMISAENTLLRIGSELTPTEALTGYRRAV